MCPMVGRGGRGGARTWSFFLWLLAAASAGCSAGPRHAAMRAPTSPSPTGPPELTTTAGPVTTAVPGRALLASSTRCSTAVLSITPGRTGVGLGHVGTPILFRNTGIVGCHLQGYPGLAALDDSGRQVVRAERTPQGYLGGLPFGASPPIVELAPGETASALVEANNNPSPPATSCASYPAILVTPPDDTRSVSVALSVSGCSLQIHPVVACDTGVLRS